MSPNLNLFVLREECMWEIKAWRKTECWMYGSNCEFWGRDGWRFDSGQGSREKIFDFTKTCYTI